MPGTAQTPTSIPSASDNVSNQSQTAESTTYLWEHPEIASLLSFLREQPEIASELKALLAMKMSEEGKPVTQEITDQDLFRRLEGDVIFRGEAIRLMANRGYITEEQARAWAPSAAGGAQPGAIQTAPPSQYPPCSPHKCGYLGC